MTTTHGASDEWIRLENAFNELIELSSEARANRLAEIRTHDPKFANELDALLETDANSTSMVDLLLQRSAKAARRDSSMPAEAPRIPGWTLIRPLGQGGMGWVWFAERRIDDFVQTAAIKVIAQHLDSGVQQARFLQERRILAQLDHPGIVRLIDGGVTEDGAPYLAMDAVDGEPIDRWCDAAAVPIAERVRLMLDALEAVGVAHQAQIVHRDLKPEHIVITAQGHVRILDFGIAKLLGQESADVTQAGVGPGTSGWASPEQRRGGPVSEKTDVYALGAVLYRICTGRRPPLDPPLPPAHAVVVEPLEEQGHVVPPELVAARRGCSADELQHTLSAGLSAVITKATTANPDDRYASVAEFSSALQACLDHPMLTGNRPVTLGGSSLSNRLNQALLAVLLMVTGGAFVAIWFQLATQNPPAVEALPVEPNSMIPVSPKPSIGEHPFWDGVYAMQSARQSNSTTQFEQAWGNVVSVVEQSFATHDANDPAIMQWRRASQLDYIADIALQAGQPELVYPLASWLIADNAYTLQPIETQLLLKCTDAGARAGEYEAALAALQRLRNDKHLDVHWRHSAQLREAVLLAAWGERSKAMNLLAALQEDTTATDLLRIEARQRYLWLRMADTGPWDAFRLLSELEATFERHHINLGTPMGRLLVALKLRNQFDRTDDSLEDPSIGYTFQSLLPQQFTTTDLEATALVLQVMADFYLPEEQAKLINLVEQRLGDHSAFDLHSRLAFDLARARCLGQLSNKRKALNILSDVSQRMAQADYPSAAPLALESTLVQAELLALLGRAPETEPLLNQLRTRLESHPDEPWFVATLTPRIMGALQIAGSLDEAAELGMSILETLSAREDTPRARILAIIIKLGHVATHFDHAADRAPARTAALQAARHACNGYAHLGDVATTITSIQFGEDSEVWRGLADLIAIARVLHAEEMALALKANGGESFANAVGEMGWEWTGFLEPIVDTESRPGLLWDALQSLAFVSGEISANIADASTHEFVSLNSATPDQLQRATLLAKRFGSIDAHSPCIKIAIELSAALEQQNQPQHAAQIRSAATVPVEEE